ncbi:MAG TPA: hypothetical protein PKB13_00910 [Clostridia bacterium]|nr:hypothetical protein [Clostridia bacterium]
MISTKKDFRLPRPSRFLLFVLAGLAVCATGVLIFLLMQKPHGHMEVSVVDAYTLRPLENSTIVIPENGMQAVTDANGKAQFYGIAIEKDATLNALLPMDCGRITLLVYREGYLPFALFYTQLYENRVRNGPTIYMFPTGTESGLEAITVIEAPAYEWVRELLEKYRPNG